MTASILHRLWQAIALSATLGLVGCQEGHGDPMDGSGTGGAGADFVSARPRQVGGVGGESGVGGFHSLSTGGAPPDPDRGGVYGAPASAEPGDVLRDAPDAEIVERVGDILFTFSSFGGLTVVDASDPAALRVLGRVRFDSIPVAAYVHEGTLLALADDHNRYVLNASTSSHDWVQTSRVMAFDVSDPENVVLTSELELRGSITDSRLEGGWLHVVTDQSRYCHECGDTPNTYVTRVDVGNPSALRLAGERDYELVDSTAFDKARAVHLATGRAYVALPVGTSAGAIDGIQVLDLSDPNGSIQERATVAPAGLSNESWQMDEHEGVLRVVTQRGSKWRTANADLVVETFDATGTGGLPLLGQASMALPRGDKLAGVRFHEGRAFVTSEDRRDPIVLVDLSNPSEPRFGQLAVPDWTFFLEPRDTRLLVIGREAAGPTDGKLHASLYDVTDVLAPVLVERVYFGGYWELTADPRTFPGDFTLFDDRGLLAVAYSGSSTDAPAGCARWENAVELFDFDWQALSRRATLRVPPGPTRLFTHAAHFLVASESELSSFDLADPAAPVRKSSVPLSQHVEATFPVGGERVLRIDPYGSGGGVKLDVTTADRVSDPATGHPLDVLSELSERDPTACAPLSDPRLLHDGDQLYLTSSRPSADSMAVGVVNVTGDSLELASTSVVPSALGPDEYDWNGSFIGLVPAGSDRVLVGSTVVVQRTTYVPQDEETPFRNTLEIFDAARPDDARHAASVDLPHALGPALLAASGTYVLATRWIPEGHDPNLARFYLDRIDVSDPSKPELLPELSLPGSLVAYDPTSQRALIASYAFEQAPSPTNGCTDALGLVDSWFDEGVCSGIRHGLHLVRVGDTAVEILDSAPVEGAYRVDQVLTTGGRTYLMLATYAGEDFKTLIVDVTGTDELSVTEVAGAGSYYGFAASPSRLVFAENFFDPSITALDTSSTPPAVSFREPIPWGTIRHLSLTDGWVVASFGELGAKSYPLGER